MDVVLEASTSESYSIKLLNKTPGNKKVNVGTVLASWTNSATLASASAADPARFQYQVGLKTHICLKGCLIMKPLDKALKENWPTCTEILGYVPWQAGVLPKTLAKARPDRFAFLELGGEGAALGKKVVATARSCMHAELKWIMRFDETKRKCMPCGVALATAKQVNVPGAGECQL